MIELPPSVARTRKQDCELPQRIVVDLRGVLKLRATILVMEKPALVTRVAQPDDAPAMAEILAEGFAGYRAWAPPAWQPPALTPGGVAGIASALASLDTWGLLALDHEQLIGHVALEPRTREDPEPAPAHTIDLWQLFVRPAWQGREVATRLLAMATAEADRRGFTNMRLWTPQGATRARRFYEREGWTATGHVHADSPSGLPTMQYARRVPTTG
jgi:GNAT superfamily N-acetyltransferase